MIYEILFLIFFISFLISILPFYYVAWEVEKSTNIKEKFSQPKSFYIYNIIYYAWENKIVSNIIITFIKLCIIISLYCVFIIFIKYFVRIYFIVIYFFIEYPYSNIEYFHVFIIVILFIILSEIIIKLAIYYKLYYKYKDKIKFAMIDKFLPFYKFYIMIRKYMTENENNYKNINVLFNYYFINKIIIFTILVLIIIKQIKMVH